MFVTSEAALAFAQRAQIVAANWSTLNVTERSGTLWRLMGTIPPAENVGDRAVIAGVTRRLGERVVVASNWQVRVTTRFKRDYIAHAIHLIAQRYEIPNLHLDDVARLLDISPSYIAHRLAKETGFSFSTHVCGFRTFAATQLISNRSLLMKQIAATVGFRDGAELDRQFQHWFGIPPLQFQATLYCQSETGALVS